MSRARKPLSRSLRVYQRAAVVFVVLSFLLLIAVLYLSVSQATIRINPKPEIIQTTFELSLVDNVQREGQIAGLLTQQEVTKSKSFTLPEEGASAVESKATGFVTLINETGSDQPLVATTRLLAENGILFRLDDAVTIPANGEVIAKASADQPGLTGEIDATRFTIPGLNVTKQSSIYAVSSEKMTGGIQYVRVLTQADIDSATQQLKQEMLNDVMNELLAGADESVFDGKGFGVELSTVQSDTEVGSETGVFSLTATGMVTGALYSTESVEVYATDQLAAEVQDGFQLAKTNIDGLQVTIEQTDIEKGIAQASVYIDGISVISEKNDLLDKSRFAGQSPQAVKTMLNVPEVIEDISVSFQPFWLKRVPTLKDHIKIVIVTRGL